MNQNKKKLNVFSRKTLTIYHVSSNCDVLDRKMKIYVLLLVCHNTNTLKISSCDTYLFSTYIEPIVDMR